MPSDRSERTPGSDDRPREKDRLANSEIPLGANGLSSTRTPPQPAHVAVRHPGSVWLQRLWLVIFVVFCVELGMLLAALPWMRVWTDNTFVMLHPGLRSFLQNNFVRGVFTGMGLLDIWIGVWEAVHYRDRIKT